MFTGLIEEVGTLLSRHAQRFEIQAPHIAPTLKLGDSVAINGICLTAVVLGPDRFQVDVSESTLSVTTAGAWRPGTRLNLERAMALGDRMGGHIVSGHVDGVSRLLRQHRLKEAWRLDFHLAEDLAPFVAPKGSITIDGTSLTVNEVTDASFSVTIIPHTGAHTTLLDLSQGSPVNLEVDCLAKYVHRILQFKTGTKQDVGYEQLERCGFLGD